MPLKQIATSKHPRARKVADHMLKTAAILQQRGVSYEQVMRPVPTAYQLPAADYEPALAR